jgi:hypothetical protein
VIGGEYPPAECETVLLAPSVSISYPPQGPATIPGGGGFCLWGTSTGPASGIAYVRAFANWGGTSVEGRPTPSVLPASYGFAFANVAAVGAANGSVKVNGYNTMNQIIATTTHDKLTIGA